MLWHSRNFGRAIGPAALPSLVVAVIAASAWATTAGPAASSPANVADWTPPGLTLRLSALERRLIDDASDGRLDDFSTIEAALVASGVRDQASLQAGLERYRAFLAELTSATSETTDALDKARLAFEHLHGRVLGGRYHADSSSVEVLLARGDYNCISASLVYASLARELGLDVVVIEAPAHAYCQLRHAAGELTIETTCETWDQATDASRRSSAAAPEAVAAHSAGAQDTSATRALSPAAMAGILYYNQGVELLGEESFGEAALANLKALAVDPTNAAARGNLLATINNWALALGREKRFDRAVTLLRHVRRIDPEFVPANVNFAAVHQLWVESLCRDDRHREAIALVERLHAEAPEVEYFDQARLDLYRQWSRALADAGHAAEAAAVLDLAGQTLVERSSELRAEAERLRGQRRSRNARD